MSRIAVAGVNYVGLVTATCFADLGNQVIGIEIVPEKVAKLNNGLATIYEPGLEEMLQRNLRAGRIAFTTDYAVGLKDAEFIFIAVGTPEAPDGAADLSQVRSAARSIGEYATGDIIVINKSTVPIGTGDLVSQLVGEQIKPGLRFHVVSNPEFLREGAALADFMQPDRVVLGGDSGAAQRVAELYEPLGAPVIITDLRTAEMIKYASNAILATRISFMNEVAHICDRLGADVKQVALGMGLDRRIGPLFLNAGIGYGGSCFPKDVKALAHMAEQADCHPQLLNAVMEINGDARRLFVQKVRDMLGSLPGKRVGVWGLAFKPNTDDMREAPSLDIVAALLEAGAHVQAYDPVAMEVARRLPMFAGVTFCTDAYEAANGTDAVLLLTEWNEFKQLDMARVRDGMRAPVLIDGRNLYEPAEMREWGFRYAGVGRS